MSCNSRKFNQRGNSYKGMIEDNDITFVFLNDSTIASVNSKNKDKTCGWNIIRFKKDQNNSYSITDKHGLEKVTMNGEEGKLVLNYGQQTFKVDRSTSLKENFLGTLDIINGFNEKNISYSCDYKLKDVANTYDMAIEKLKSGLKHPNSMIVDKVKINKFRRLKDGAFVDTDVKVVHVEYQAKNSFGNYKDGNYYLYNFPKSENYPKGLELERTSVLTSYEYNKLFDINTMSEEADIFD